VLGIPLYVLNFQEDFGRVIDYFVDEYNRGRTPNPCVRCNDWLKFGKLARYAEAVGAKYVASGHYARTGVDPRSGEAALLRGLDHKKDQSYVLFGMSRDTLAHTLLPIGGYEKSAVRALAEELKLPVFNKPDSQEICFVPNQDYAGLVKRRKCPTDGRGVLAVLTDNEIGATVGEPGPLRIAWSVKAPVPAPVHPAVRGALDGTLAVLRSLGHEVVQGDPAYGGVQQSFLIRYGRGVRDDLVRFIAEAGIADAVAAQ
jgi:hypothetical protein